MGWTEGQGCSRERGKVDDKGYAVRYGWAGVMVAR